MIMLYVLFLQQFRSLSTSNEKTCANSANKKMLLLPTLCFYYLTYYFKVVTWIKAVNTSYLKTTKIAKITE